MKYDNDRLGAALKLYLGTDPLPMHMPGGKRNPDFVSQAFMRDITEIGGFDNLHSPKGLLKDMEDCAASLWKAKNAFISVNGSTALILAAIWSASILNPGTKILTAMNCHLAVWNAIELTGSTIVPLMPAFDIGLPFAGPVAPSDIERNLARDPSIKTVIITSPTYEGVQSDTEEIFRITRKYDALLITDCAHGAHLGLDDAFFGPDSRGDIVIKSLHKTLSSPTQTAVMLLHEGCPVDVSLIRRGLDIFETSSPSYVLLQGVSKCLAGLNAKGSSILKPWENAISYAESNLKGLRNFKLWEAPVRERSKFVLMGLGDVLFEYLRGTFNIECEVSFPSHLIAMTGIGDTEESLKRFCDAVITTDGAMEGQYIEAQFISRPYPRFKTTLQEAARYRLLCEELEPEKAIGRVSGEFIYGFPPGIPLLMPGETITEETLKILSRGDIHLLMGGGRNYNGLIPVLP
ncbi:DegT/DnrJ/EryC1/StrS family aminotransferase [Butyrivibrio sp. AE2032]|uniref:Orn/Lys/Arg family decarboxylase n=1 Tax=Butyrivibrio sp. AE2032 TaxID=1458463 RepID=UPI0005557FC5|nr:DegT/DnrJ/EryC1/StrS family aminotransferase [Butyrivibrio sp. AE2032]